MGTRVARAVRGPGALRVAAQDYEQADTDGAAVKVDIKMSDVSKGKKIGSGSFGDVFEGKSVFAGEKMLDVKILV